MPGFNEAATPHARRTAAADLLTLVDRERGCNGETLCAGAVDAFRAAVTREMRESEEQLAEAQRIANVGSWECDVATGRHTFSDQFCRMFGFEPATPPRLEQLRTLIHPDDLPRVLRIESAARQTLQPVAEQCRLVLPGAPVRTVMARTRVVLDARGEPVRIIGVVQDVSERVAHEEELRRAAVQQAAVANFGQLALSGVSLDVLFNQVIVLLRNILDAEVEIVAGGHSGSASAGSLAVPIASTDERPWGLLRVTRSSGVPSQPVPPVEADGVRPSFHSNEGDFLRSVATVLAQAIARARADAELGQRTLQQSAIAELGRAALTKVDGETIAHACELVACGLGVTAVDFVRGGFVVPKAHLGAEEAAYVESMTNILSEAIEREEARAALQQTTRSLQLVLESTLEGICTIDAEGRCTMVNAAAARMFGRTPEEMLGANMHELVHARHADGEPYPRRDCPISRVVRDSGARSVIGDVFWRADGTQLPVDYSAAPIVDGDVTVGAVVAITDISARRALEQKLAQANRLSGLGRLAATVAHEFNNVLMGISPFIEVIRRKPERAEGALDQIASAVARGKRITGDILRFTRPAELVRADFAVEPWLRDLAAHAHAVLSSKHRVVVDMFDPALCVFGDRNQLHQVVMNLVLNAHEAMAAGGAVTLSARRELPGTTFHFGVVAAPERFVHIAVADSGCGMDAEVLGHIFEPLFTTKPSGTGLGLAVAHQVVHRHGGEIFVESSAGAGTTFHLFIPVAEGGGESPAPLPPPPMDSKAWHLLLVDDDEVVVSGLVSLLELEGMKVDAAGSGAAALDYLCRVRPHVVLLDVGLPDMDGTEVYTRIVAMHPELPVVFSTGHADTARLEELEHGRVVSLLKPYDLAALLAAIEKVVGP